MSFRAENYMLVTGDTWHVTYNTSYFFYWTKNWIGGNFFDIGAIIRTHQEIQCLPYAGFSLNLTKGRLSLKVAISANRQLRPNCLIVRLLVKERIANIEKPVIFFGFCSLLFLRFDFLGGLLVFANRPTVHRGVVIRGGGVLLCIVYSV